MVVPDGFEEHFDGAQRSASDGTTTGNYDADWQIWYDGAIWGGGHRLLLGGGEQRIGLDNGSYGLSRNFGDIGGITLTIDHAFGGDGWYEVLANGVNVVSHQSPFDGVESFVLPAGSTTIEIKVGSQGSGFHEGVLRSIVIE